jgi:HPt (histidine-containing phosphotransfer) domain-containing protein
MSQGIMNLNRALALERVGGDEELLREIAGLFLEDYPSLITQIEQAVAASDANSLERAAHSLKGSIANFGSDPAYHAAFELEQIGRNKNLEHAAEAYARLLSVMGHVCPELEALSAGTV